LDEHVDDNQLAAILAGQLGERAMIRGETPMDAFHSRFRGAGIWGFCLGCVLMMVLVSCSKPEAPQPETASAAQPAISPELAQVREQIEAAQKTMETLYPRLMAVESVARTNDPSIQGLFEEMTAKRQEYQAKLNKLPEMKTLRDQLELNQAELGMLLEREQALVKQESK